MLDEISISSIDLSEAGDEDTCDGAIGFVWMVASLVHFVWMRS